MQYIAIIEGDDQSGYSAYVPDLSGCIAAGDTYAEVEQLIREAIPFHLEGMIEMGEPIPTATSRAIMVEASIPIHA